MPVGAACFEQLQLEQCAVSVAAVVYEATLTSGLPQSVLIRPWLIHRRVIVDVPLLARHSRRFPAALLTRMELKHNGFIISPSLISQHLVSYVDMAQCLNWIQPYCTRKLCYRKDDRANLALYADSA